MEQNKLRKEHYKQQYDKQMSMNCKPSTTSQLVNYINQHFNPKLLPALILHLLTQHSDIQNMTLVGKQNVSNKNRVRQSSYVAVITNNPTISLLFTNMKFYDVGVIKKQNCVIQATQNEKIFPINSKDVKGYRTPQNILKRNVNLTNFRKNQKYSLLVTHLQNLKRSFSIFEYRIADLTLFIVALNQFVTKTTEAKTKTMLNQIIFKLEDLCNKLHKKLENVKQQLENIYQNISKNEEKQQNIEENDKNTRFYSLEQHRKMLKQKLRQIHEKYTNISKKIFTRQNKYQQLNEKQKKFRLKLLTQSNINQKYDENLDKVRQNSIVSIENNSKNSFGSYRKQNSNKNVSYRSILKNKLNMKGKNNRISIQLITNLLEAQRNRKIDKFNIDTKFSRFRHRNGVNIGSGTQIKNKNGKGKMKKQVKIQMMQTDRKQGDQISDVQYRKSNKLKRGSSISKNSKNSKIEIFEDLCQKALDDQENQSNCSKRRNKKFYSCREILTLNTSQHSIISKSSKSRSQSKHKSVVRNSNRKLTRKNTFCYSRPIKSYASCRNFKPIKSSKNIKIDPINQPLKNILDQAMKRKRANRLQNRNGRIITDIDNLQVQNETKAQHFKRRNLRMKSNKHKFNRINYNNILQILHNDDKDKSNQSINKPAANMKDINQSMRRMGIEIISAVIDPVRTSQNINGSHKDSRTKQKSQNLSVSSSKRYHLSNSKIAEQQANVLLKRQARPIKMRTQASQFLQAPAEFKVNLQQKPQILQNYTKFYNNVQCTLYQTTKKYNRDQMLNGHFNEDNRMLQLTPMSNFYVKKFIHKQNSQLETMDRMVKLEMFQQEGVKLMLSKRIVTAANQLKQTDFV